MSKLFFDHLTVLEEVEVVIKKSATSREEKEELWMLVDEIVTHKVVKSVLDKLPRKNHEEFIALFHKCPHDEQLILGYIGDKTGQKIGEVEKRLGNELKIIGSDILKELKQQDETSAETRVSKK